MKKYASIFLFCFITVLLINLAITQNEDKIRFQIAEPSFNAILPQTHAKLTLSKSFMDFWQNVKSDNQNPKAVTFLQKSNSTDKAKLKILDYTENDPFIVVAEIKNSLISSNFKLENEKILTLDKKQINNLFYQDSKQNVRAFYVFKIGNSVFSVEIITKYTSYVNVDKYWFEILNKIKASDTQKHGFDKILLSKSVSVLVPSILKYNLPVRNSVFVGKLDSLNFQCFVYQSKQSTRKIANDIELKLIGRLGFRRINGDIAKTNEIETVDFYGIIEQNKMLNLHIRAYRDTRVIMIFEYENIEITQKILTEIKQSTAFSQQTEIPDSFIPFAFMIDNDNDAIPDYFTINIIFFSKSKEIIVDDVADSSVSIKIYDQNNKMVYKSLPVEIFSPRDCLPGGKCSVFFAFDGLWLSKIKDRNYSISVSVLFDKKKLEFNGSLTDLIIR